MGTYKNINGNLELIPGVTLFADNPIGSIIPFGGTTAPKGWFICQGQAISRTDYAELFAVIGTSFGNGDGTTTFNLPDLRESTTKGAGLTGLSNNHMDADGLAVGEFTDDRIQQMTGEFEWRTAGDNILCDIISNKSNVTGVFEKNVNSGQYYVIATSGGKYADGGNLVFDASNVARTGATTEVKAVGVNYIIKAKQVAVPSDFEGAAAAAGTAAAQEVVALKQNITDDSLETTAKTVPGAINELKDKKVDRYYITNSSYNLNDATAQGIYELNTSCVNRPSGADGGTMIVTFNPDNNYVVQAYLSTNGAVANRYKPGKNAEWTNWVNPFDNRPQLYYAKNIQGTSDASGNIILANSKDSVVIVDVRIRGNNTWSLGYSTSAGYYIHVQGYNGETLPNTTVYYDIIYYQYDWTA